MTLTAKHVETVLRSIPGAYGRQVASLEILASGATAALTTAPPGLTVQGAAAFLATMAQESGAFRYLEEIRKDGPYAPFIGRTFEQVTHRTNYAEFGVWCAARGLVSDPDAFVKDPAKLADVRWAWLGGIWFWQARGIWAYGNRGDFLATQQAVNLGSSRIGSSTLPNGITERRKWYDAWLQMGADLLPEPPAHPWDGTSFPGADAFKLGQQHPAVTLLGQRLVVHGFTARHDQVGSYTPGPRFTEYDRGNVADFQKAQGWTGSNADGYPGAATWARLMAAPAPKPAPAPPPAPKPPARSAQRKVLTLNAQYPPFAPAKGVLSWAKRVLLLAKVILGSDATVVGVQEIGKVQAAALSAALGKQWKYVRAAGANGNGLNAVFRRADLWTLDGDPHDWNLPSYGQMQRTLIVCRLVHSDGGVLLVGATHFAAAASDLSRAAANIAKLAQVKKVDSLTDPLGDELVLCVDLARTDDDDDVAWLKKQGWALPGRSDATPEAFLTRPGVAVVKTQLVRVGKATDHDARLLVLTTPAPKK